MGGWKTKEDGVCARRSPGGGGKREICEPFVEVDDVESVGRVLPQRRRAAHARSARLRVPRSSWSHFGACLAPPRNVGRQGVGGHGAPGEASPLRCGAEEVLRTKGGAHLAHVGDAEVVPLPKSGSCQLRVSFVSASCQALHARRRRGGSGPEACSVPRGTPRAVARVRARSRSE